MRAIIIFSAIFFSFNYFVKGQSHTLYGRVADEDLLQLRGVRIQITDKYIIGLTDSAGRFKIELPPNTEKLIFSYIGYDLAIIKLNDSCDTIELVMMPSGSYDYISSRKIDRLRLRLFNKLSELHLQAYKKGFFLKESMCYSREFVRDKPKLDSIEKDELIKDRHIKLTFEKLKLGDTVKIPFSGSYHADGTDRSTLSFYSIFADMRYYNYTIKGVILGKNRHKWEYNLVLKVTSCQLGKYPAIFEGRVMAIGEVFSYNMKTCKILDE